MAFRIVLKHAYIQKDGDLMLEAWISVFCYFEEPTNIHECDDEGKGDDLYIHEPESCFDFFANPRRTAVIADPISNAIA